jgi:AraC-like DNA-binding protein
MDLRNRRIHIAKNLKSKLLPERSLTMSGRGEIRVGPVLAIPAVLTEFGVSPSRAFAQAGVDPRLFEDPDNRMPLEDLGNLFDTCVVLTDCRHFGLLVGQRFDLKNFGLLGLLLRTSATVGEALRDLLMHLHLHDRGAAPVLLAPYSSSVILGYSIYRHGIPAATQILDVAIAIGYGILAELCGPTWKPLRVQFAHSGSGSTEPYRRAFRSSVSFDAEVSGLAFTSSWLERPIEGADAALHDLVAKAIRDAEAGDPMSFADQVEGALPQMVLSGMASSEAIARLFAINERTLRRRLEAEGKSLQQLISQARFELAQQLLRNTGLSVAVIATALRYEDPNAFSRAFRNWAKLSPTQWRARVRRSRD